MNAPKPELKSDARPAHKPRGASSAATNGAAGGAAARPKSARRRSRELALQGLYEWLVGGADTAAIEAHMREQDGFDKCDSAHFDALLHGVIRDAAELDAILALIGGARRSLRFLYYIYADDETGRRPAVVGEGGQRHGRLEHQLHGQVPRVTSDCTKACGSVRAAPSPACSRRRTPACRSTAPARWRSGPVSRRPFTCQWSWARRSRIQGSSPAQLCRAGHGRVGDGGLAVFQVAGKTPQPARQPRPTGLRGTQRDFPPPLGGKSDFSAKRAAES